MDLERRHVRLQGSSNLRDIGGYPTVCRRRVKWGHVYRSGALWGLTETDWAWMNQRGFAAVCDLRSDAEREITPTRWLGEPNPRQVDQTYDAALLFGGRGLEQTAGIGALEGELYVRFARLLAPSFKGLFQALLEGAAPALVHCTAGQDRTGLAVGILLTALGVDQATIHADFLLSTDLRRPEHEMNRTQLAALADSNVVAAFYDKLIARHGPDVFKPKHLLDAQGRPLLEIAFTAIEREWGSIDDYLGAEMGIGPKQRKRLQDQLLESD